jgi:Concanavalin A-like lectin/glucanases superfamily/PEP-CTERM motif
MRKRIVGVICGGLFAIVTSAGNAAMLLHYPFDQVDGAGPFTTPDTSGLGNTGTLALMDNTNLVVPGMIGNAMRFDGGAGASDPAGADRVEVADGDPDFDRSYSEFTFAAWLNPSSTAMTNTVDTWIAGKLNTGSQRGWQIGLSGTAVVGSEHQIFITFFPTAANANAQEFYLGTNASVAADTWVHLAMVFKASDSLKMYINGGLALTAPVTVATLNGANNRPLQIGNRGTNLASSWNGLMDEVYIFDSALTPEEISAIVPEPGSMTLAAFGIALAVGARHRRRIYRAV